MTEPMDIARFEQIVEAYGANPLRWPADERAAAEALMRTDPRARDLLSQADALDALLFAHRAPEPSPTLRRMVVEAAPRPRRRGRLRLWWSGIALALAAGGGALAGSAATAALDPTVSNVPLYGHDYLPAYEATTEENAS